MARSVPQNQCSIPNVFLGFSGGILSLIFETLAASASPHEVVIVENLPNSDEVSFQHPEIRFRRMEAGRWQRDPEKDRLLFSVAHPQAKKAIFDYFEREHGVCEEDFASLFSPHARVASSAVVGKGCYLEPGVIVSPFAQIGFGVTLNRATSVGHHTIVAPYVTINPGCHIAGHCQIGRETVVGMGTTIFDHLQIGERSVIGGGSVVMQDVPDGVLAAGNPCRVVKRLSAVSGSEVGQ